MSTVDTQAARVAYVGAYKAVRVGGGGEWRTWDRCRVCFITAGPITKLFAWVEEESGGHVL